MRGGVAEPVGEERLRETPPAVLARDGDLVDEPAPRSSTTVKQAPTTSSPSAATRRFHGSKPGRRTVPAAHSSYVSPVRSDHSPNAVSMTSWAACRSASLSAVRSSYPGGSGRSGTRAPAGSSSTHEVQPSR